MRQKIFRVGHHSLAVIIPAVFVRAAGIKAGDTAKVVTRPDRGFVTIHFQGAVQLPLPKAEKIYTANIPHKPKIRSHAE